jgi:hypothetical protein
VPQVIWIIGKVEQRNLDEKPAERLEDSVDFVDHGFNVDYMFEDLGGNDDIGAVIGEGHVFGKAEIKGI